VGPSRRVPFLHRVGHLCRPGTISPGGKEADLELVCRSRRRRTWRRFPIAPKIVSSDFGKLEASRHLSLGRGLGDSGGGESRRRGGRRGADAGPSE